MVQFHLILLGTLQTFYLVPENKTSEKILACQAVVFPQILSIQCYGICAGAGYLR